MPKFPIRVPRTVLQAIAVLLLAALTTAGALQAVDDPATTTPARPSPAPAATVTLGGPGHSTIPAPSPAERQVADNAIADHASLRWDTTLPAHVAERYQAGLEHLAATDQLPLTTPDAAPTVPGCTSRFVRNYSSRGGVAPRELVAHYTVSRPGSGLAIVAGFDNARNTTSANFVIDTNGACWYIVRDTDKAWTQASANPYAISIEFVAMGTETALTAAQLAKGGAVWAHEAKKWNIPLHLGKVTNCLPTTPGLVDHAMLGACGGGHHDLRPLYGTHIPGFGQTTTHADDLQALGPLLAAARAAAAPAASHGDGLTKAERTAARCLTNERTIAHRHGGWQHISAGHLQAATECKEQLRRADARITAAAAATGWSHARRRDRHTAITKLLRP